MNWFNFFFFFFVQFFLYFNDSELQNMLLFKFPFSHIQILKVRCYHKFGIPNEKKKS